jgi:predicted TIM-barrel fold metal-dependent hydrolase
MQSARAAGESPQAVSACDAHFHVFGPEERYAYSSDLRYQPPHAPLEDYLSHAAELGIGRYVLVQPSAYGRDNRCMLDAMRALGKDKCRGIVDIDESTPQAELEQLHAAGVRGVRINVNPIKPPEPGFSSGMLKTIHALDDKCARLGWMLDFLTPGWLTRELIPVLRDLRSPFSVAHFGMFPAMGGPQQSSFVAFLSLVRGCERCWVKLTGAYRISLDPGFADTVPLARAVIAAAPDRVLWGSDYPHLSFADKVNSHRLFQLLQEWAPDERIRNKILVENPERCFGF